MKRRTVAIIGALALLWVLPSAAGGSSALTDAPPPLTYVPDLGGTSPGSACGGTVKCVAPTGGTHTTVQAAVDAAASGDTIQVRTGTYHENISIAGKALTLLGGFPASGWTERNPADHPTTIDGLGDDSVVTLADVGMTKIDGFTITGGAGSPEEFDQSYGGGIRVDYPGGSPIITNNVIEDNDNAVTAPSGAYGGGLSLRDVTDVVVSDNIIRNNVSWRGAGAHIVGTGVVERNLIEGNTADGGDHAGGLHLVGDGGPISITQNLIRSNTVGGDLGYGWGGGVQFVVGAGRSERNRYVSNSAPSIGSGLFIDEEADVDVIGDLFHDNACPSDGGAAIYVDGDFEGDASVARITNVTAANHACGAGRGHGVFVEGGSQVTVRNGIFWGNGGTNQVFICTSPGSQLCNGPASSGTVRYSIVEGGHAGTGNLNADPTFVSGAADDYHLQPNSPAIDAANPSDPVGAEPAPNGGRRNMGAYGGTSEATTSGGGTTVRPDVLVTFGTETVGSDVYSDRGKDQKIGTKIRRKQSALFGFVVQNDGPSPDRFSVAGCASKKGFQMTFEDPSGDVSGGIGDGTYETPTMDPGEELPITLTIDTTRKAKGRKASCRLTATSIGVPDVIDAAIAKVKVK